MNRHCRHTLVVIAIAGIGACGGNSSDTPSTPDPDPPIVLDPSTAVSTKALAPGVMCPNGGIEVETGIDENSNGVLDPAEVDNTEIVCNGTDGTNALVNLTPVAPGNNCDTGGVQIDSGADLNNDGVLDTNEITVSDFVCNGMSGANGTPGISFIIDFSSEPVGANCQNGGTRIDSGADTNANLVLDPGEISDTDYLCITTTTGTQNTAPIVPAEITFNVSVNEPIEATLLATDEQNDRITFAIAQMPVQGTITDFNALTGQFTYQPGPNYLGVDAFAYRADDGNITSAESIVTITTEEVIIPPAAFQLNTTQIRFVDYPDGVSERTYLLEGSTSNGLMRADLMLPAALSATNLRAIEDNNTVSTVPLVTAPLTNLPTLSGTSTIKVSLFDGVDTQRTIGERQLDFTYVYDWQSDGTTLTVAPAPNAQATAIYFTTDGELAVSLQLNNANANVFAVTDNNELSFVVASLFADDQLGATLNTADFRSGDYYYRVDFDQFPVVDSFGKEITAIEGQFHVSDAIVPFAQSVVWALYVQEGQATHIDALLSGSGGTGPLSHTLVSEPAFGNAIITDANAGSVTYTPITPFLMIDDAFTFKVSDGLAESNIARARFDVSLANSLTGRILSLEYNTANNLVKIFWADTWQDELGFRVESFDPDCTCWILEEALAPHPGVATGGWNSPRLQWQVNAQAEATAYRLIVELASGDVSLYPGTIVAYPDGAPTIVANQSNPLSGIVEFTVVDADPNLTQLTYDVLAFPNHSHGERMCVSSSWPQFTCLIDTRIIPNGTLNLRLDAKYFGNSETRVLNTNFTIRNFQGISTNHAVRRHQSEDPTSPPFGSFDIQIAAAADIGVSMVDLTLDAIVQGAMTQPNGHAGVSQEYCLDNPDFQLCDHDFDVYEWRVDNLLPGQHEYSYTVTYSDATTRSVTDSIALPISVLLSEPIQSNVTEPMLTIAGQVGATQNPVTITVTLGDQTVLQTSDPDFSTVVDLTTFEPGRYTIRVVAVESGSGFRGSVIRSVIYSP